MQSQELKEVIDATNFNYIVALGNNIGIDKAEDIREFEGNLSVESIFTVLTVGLIYKPGVKIILSGGYTAGNIVPSEAEAMKNTLISIFSEIPEKDIIEEKISIDTQANAEEVKKILESRGDLDKKIALVSSGYHVGNAKLIFMNEGIPIECSFRANEVLGISSQNNSVLNWSKSQRGLQSNLTERIRRVLLLIDPKSKLLRKITNITRK